MGVYVEKSAGISEVPEIYLKKVLEKYNGCAGLAGVVLKDNVPETMCTPLDVGAKLEDVQAMFAEYKDIPVLAWFGEPPAHTDSIQPFPLFQTEDGSVELLAFIEGPYPQFKQADDARSEQFHVAYSKLTTMIEPIWTKHDGDVAKIMDELDNPFAAEALKGLSTGDGLIVFMSSASRILKIGRDLTKGTFSWGYTSDPMGYFEGQGDPVTQKPKSFGFAGKAVAAVVETITPKKKVVAEAPKEEPKPSQVHTLAEAPKTAHTAAPIKKKVVATPVAGTGEQPVIGDTRKVEPAAPVTATAVKAPKADKVWITPDKGNKGENDNNKYRHRFYSIYCGEKSNWPSEIVMNDRWKTGPSIMVERNVVRREHLPSLKELNGVEKVANALPAAKDAPKETYQPFTGPVDSNEVPIVPQTEMDNVEDYITSPAFKAITDKAGELLKDPEKWAKVEEAYPSYTDLLQIQLMDTVKYDYKALTELGSRSIKSLALLLIEWRREALKNRPAVAAAPQENTPAVPQTGATPVIRRKVAK